MGWRGLLFVFISIFLSGCHKFTSQDAISTPSSRDLSAIEMGSASGVSPSSTSSLRQSTSESARVVPRLNPPESSSVQLPQHQVPKIWVFKSDESLVQFLGGDVPISAHQKVLASAGVSVFASNRAIKKNMIPKSIGLENALHRVRKDVWRYPATPIYSGVHNAFLIASSDLPKAQTVGFSANIGESAFAVPCAGKSALFIFGQSNSANSGDVPDREPIAGIYMFFNGFCYPAADPLLGASMYAGGGSVWMPLARKFSAENPRRELVLFSFGVGGSSVREWATGGLWESRLNLALDQARGAGLNVIKVFWHQGESDTIDGTSSATYIAYFTDVIGKVRAKGVRAPVYMAIASYMAQKPYFISREVQSAQLKLIEQNYSGVELGLIADFLPEEARSKNDGLHFSASGLMLAGEEWYARAFAVRNRDRDMIRAYYNTYLSRHPMESDVDYWQARKASASMSLSELRSEILGTPEAYIRDLYLRFARRQPEYDGYLYWYRALESRSEQDVRAEFENAVRDLSLGGDRFDIIDGTLQPRADRFRFDRINGLWIPK